MIYTQWSSFNRGAHERISRSPLAIPLTGEVGDPHSNPFALLGGEGIEPGSLSSPVSTITTRLGGYGTGLLSPCRFAWS